MSNKVYSYLALIYSHLMRSIDYNNWADYIIKISSELKTKKIYALEIACGTGNLAKRLKDVFDFYVATDYSLSMLKQFEDENILRVVCDMTSLPFKKKFNFVFSTFDSINYLTSKEKILRLLKSVESCLIDDGIFTFDVSLENNSIRYQRYLNRKGSYDGIQYKQISKYDTKKRIHYNIFDITLQDGSKVREIHRQKIYEFDEYFKIIERSNFYVMNCFEAFTFNHANAESERAQFILKKKNKC